jgi:hypothetical protein
MASLAEFDQRLEEIIREFTARIVVSRCTEFDTVWEAAIRVCERYQLGKSIRETTDAGPSNLPALGYATSSAEPSAVDAPVQTHPPIAS